MADVKIRVLTEDEASAKIKEIDQNLEKFDKRQKESSKTSQKHGSLLKDLAAEFTGAGLAITAVAGALGFSIAQAMEAEKVDAQLNAVLKSTGGVAGLTADELDNMAMSLSRVTAVEDETIKRGEALLLTFTKVGREVFPQAIESALDMSAALGQDLQSSVIQLGKALNDPIQGVTALRRVGVSFTEDQQEMIKSLVESGKTLEAQQFILGELQTEFGGAAEAAGSTFAGDVEKAKNSVGNLGEEIGKGLIPLLQKGTKEAVSFVDALTGEIAVHNRLIEIQKRGAITLDDLVRISEDLGHGRTDLASVTAYLDEKERQYLATLPNSFEWTERNAYGRRFLAETTEEAAEATDEFIEKSLELGRAQDKVLEKLRAAGEDGAGFWTDVNRGVAGDIEDTIKNLEFRMAGGGLIEQQLQMVNKALEEGKITPEKAKELYGELFVQAENLQVKLGEIDAKEAAENISETLGVSLGEASRLMKEIKDASPLQVQGEIAIAVRLEGNKLALQVAETLMGGMAHSESSLLNIPQGVRTEPVTGAGGVTGRAGEVRQFGGPVMANRPYLVGEQGPEMFVPNISGNIEPNNKLGGGDTITFHIYNPAAMAMALDEQRRISDRNLNASMGV